jgi:hypothetical protein
VTQVISPTPGRIVWFHPAPHDGVATLNGQPLAAIVSGVHSDRLINLAVFDAYGNSQQRSNVHLVQPGDATPDSAHATWMPYQLGQATKTEAALAVADVAIAAAGVAVSFAAEAVTETSEPAAVQVTQVDPTAIFADANGTSASEIGLVTNEAAPSSSEPAQA